MYEQQQYTKHSEAVSIGITIFIYINTKTANAFKNKLPFLY
uniref:Uncharacterized protein n=1 Tax=Anguilla anguilla TaxID=7936 RepID=A0A0E9SM16_ANGAN